VKRRKRIAPVDPAAAARVESGVAAYQAFYGRAGLPLPTFFRTEQQLDEDREAADRIIAEERAAYTGPLKTRQVELVQRRDEGQLPYRLIAEYSRPELDEEEVRACLGVSGSSYDAYEEYAPMATLANRDPEAWHWSRTEHFDQPNPHAALLRIAEIICPEAVARLTCRQSLGTLWRLEDENAEMARRFPQP